jgi:hypothetical protein
MAKVGRVVVVVLEAVVEVLSVVLVVLALVVVVVVVVVVAAGALSPPPPPQPPMVAMKAEAENIAANSRPEFNLELFIVYSDQVSPSCRRHPKSHVGTFP